MVENLHAKRLRVEAQELTNRFRSKEDLYRYLT
jgi:hypothetical protein